MNPVYSAIARLCFESLVPGGGVVLAAGEVFKAWQANKADQSRREILQKAIEEFEQDDTLTAETQKLMRDFFCLESQLLERVLASLEDKKEQERHLKRALKDYQTLEAERLNIQRDREYSKTFLPASKPLQQGQKISREPPKAWTIQNPFVPKWDWSERGIERSDIWNWVWLLSGQSLSNPTIEHPLLGLPQPIMTALISSLRQTDAWCLGDFKLKTTELLHEGSRLYRYYSASGESCFYVPKDIPTLDVGIVLQKSSYSSTGQSLLCGFTHRFAHLQNALFSLLSQFKEETLRIRVSPKDDSLVSLALIDTLTLIERVSDFLGIPISLPKIILELPKKAVDSWLIPLHHYLGCSPFDLCGGESVAREQPSKSPFWVPLPQCLYFESHSGEKGLLSTKQIESTAQNKSLEWLRGRCTQPAELLKMNPKRSALDYFARRFFRVAELKSEQLSALRGLFAARQSYAQLVILPTGYGKSLIYQLYACLVPRLNLVISPLNALIEDQVAGLHSLGFFPSTAAINSSVSQNERAAIMSRLAQYRLIYISPERILIDAFRARIEHAQQNGCQIGAFVIDEAHCASEWGHDFRLAYLQLSNYHHKLQSQQPSPVHLLAVTATAPDIVRQDICQILQIPPKNVEQRASSERQNFSFSFHSVPYGTGTRKPLGGLLSQTIPKVLKLSSKKLLEPQKDRYPHAGIVFSIFVKSYLNRKYYESLFPLKDKIVSETIAAEDAVGVHGSSLPFLCQNCASPLLLNVYGKVICQNCSHKHLKDSRGNYAFAQPDNWPETIQQTQRQFKQGRLAVMVATKGFGMGIDKDNVRYVIHHSLSSSISAYYQEAGRAGRDGQHAHVSLIMESPHSSCRAELESRQFRPKCMDQSKGHRSWKCPYDKAGLCDYGIQSDFIESGFGDRQETLGLMKKVYQQCQRGTGRSFSDKQEKAAFRLLQIGMISGYTTTYRSNHNNGFDKDITAVFNESTDWVSSAAEHFQRLNDLASVEWLQSKKFGSAQDYITHAGNRLLETIESKIRYQRYVMLFRLLQLIEVKHCRRIELRSIFDGQELAQENYRCGFCDNCHPELMFERTEAQLPDVKEEINTFSKHVLRLLRSDKLSDVAQASLFEAIEAHKIGGSVLAQAKQQIELNPNQLNPYFVAARLAHQSGLDEAQSWRDKGIEVGFARRCAVEEMGVFLEDIQNEPEKWAVFLGQMPQREGLAWLKQTLPVDHPVRIQTEFLLSLKSENLRMQTQLQRFKNELERLERAMHTTD